MQNESKNGKVCTYTVIHVRHSVESNGKLLMSWKAFHFTVHFTAVKSRNRFGYNHCIIDHNINVNKLISLNVVLEAKSMNSYVLNCKIR